MFRILIFAPRMMLIIVLLNVVHVIFILFEAEIANSNLSFTSQENILIRKTSPNLNYTMNWHLLCNI